MKGKVVSLCFDKIQDIVQDLGYVLVDVEYKKSNNGMVLEIVIDKDGGVNINDCEKVSRALDAPLDEIDPTKGASYSLNVSSMGLDRPLTTEYQFNKYKGKEIELKFYEPLKPYNKKTMIGLLQEWDEDSVTITSDMEEGLLVGIPRKIIAQIVPVIKF